MSDIETAKVKLGSIIQFENLPRDRNAVLWNRIERECQLTLDELAALQNAVCSSAVGKRLHDTLNHLLMIEVRRTCIKVTVSSEIFELVKIFCESMLQTRSTLTIGF